ncbi:hypothetical protein BJL95_19015 [Methylomonas sp. LWB]|uniref:hypothetical protein n=1 Tax=Methylomonas sp. LWB TaxID=1905845 RepID=UPI0008DACDF2|nr:hypothetical protein [Methylomonas sp. LWB]OHX34620.1 hypothetical protein BJL95_19015 [Methylomonas sp. LWB]
MSGVDGVYGSFTIAGADNPLSAPIYLVKLDTVNAKTVGDQDVTLTLPNVDGHKPGAQVEMYSYDHDLEEFVAIGLGTVSTDGSIIKSNDGVGVIKSGWHCGSQPGGGRCTLNCGECQSCDTSCTCYWDNSKTPTTLTNIPRDVDG